MARLIAKSGTLVRSIVGVNRANLKRTLLREERTAERRREGEHEAAEQNLQRSRHHRLKTAIHPKTRHSYTFEQFEKDLNDQLFLYDNVRNDCKIVSRRIPQIIVKADLIPRTFHQLVDDHRTKN